MPSAATTSAATTAAIAATTPRTAAIATGNVAPRAAWLPLA